MKLILATKNQGKVRELRELLQDLGIEVSSLQDVEGLPEVIEDGDSFFENAMKKARTIAEATGLMALADDSGLEVDALGGGPGVRSARFSGPGATDESNNQKLLEMLEGVPPEGRGARFRCVMVLYHPSGKWLATEGACEGLIGTSPRGTKGFGYDPVFFLPDRGKTMAELDLEEKNRISHRGKALGALREKLPGFLSSLPPTGTSS